jgi:hypothetical protein
MNELEAGIALLSSRCPSVRFVGTVETDEEADAVFGSGDAVCIVDLAGEGTPLQGAALWQRYTLRFYGAGDLAMLDAHRAARVAMFHPVWTSLPLPPEEVGDRLVTLAIVNGATGPLPESDGRRVLMASASMKFSY